MAEFSLNEVIELAIQIEKSGYKFYEQALQRKKLNEPVRKVLEKLRNDEIKHEATFKNLRTSEDHDVLGDPIDWQDAASYLRAISNSHVFSQPDAAIKKTQEIGKVKRTWRDVAAGPGVAVGADAGAAAAAAVRTAVDAEAGI